MGNVQLQKSIQYSNMHLWLKLGNQNYQRIHHWWIGAKAPSFSRIFIHVFDAAHHVFEDLFNGASLKSWGSGPAKTGQTMTEIRVDGSRPEYSTTFMTEHTLGKFIFRHIPSSLKSQSKIRAWGQKLWITAATVDALRESQRSWQSHCSGNLPLKSSAKEATKRKRSKLTFDGPYSACQCHSPDLVQKERQIDKEMSGTAMDRTRPSIPGISQYINQSPLHPSGEGLQVSIMFHSFVALPGSSPIIETPKLENNHINSKIVIVVVVVVVVLIISIIIIIIIIIMIIIIIIIVIVMVIIVAFVIISSSNSSTRRYYELYHIA